MAIKKPDYEYPYEVRPVRMSKAEICHFHKMLCRHQSENAKADSNYYKQWIKTTQCDLVNNIQFHRAGIVFLPKYGPELAELVRFAFCEFRSGSDPRVTLRLLKKFGLPDDRKAHAMSEFKFCRDTYNYSKLSKAHVILIALCVILVWIEVFFV